jgi:transposase
MTMSMVKTPAVTGGVDTRADRHVAAALDGIGGLLRVLEFPAAPTGYARLLGWLRGFGTVRLVGIEGTGSYGAGLARHVSAAARPRALIITGPDDIRTRFTGQTPAGLVAGLAALRPRPGSTVRYHTLLSLRELGRRACCLGGQLARLDELIIPLVTARSPGRLGLFDAGPDTAAVLLIAARDHPARLRSEAAWARLRRSRRPRARCPGTGSTAAATGKPTMPCGGS